MPDDNDRPDDENKPGDDEEHGHEGPHGIPPGVKPRQLKVVLSSNAQDVKFADLFGFTLGPTHGIVKFGVLQPETGEFMIHTQIAMTPQGMVALSQALQKNIEKIRKMSKPGQGPKMN